MAPNTAPADIKRSEAFFESYDNTRLYYQRWKPENPKAMMVITHGQAEHSECYHRVVAALHSLQIDVWAWDMRGHGRSEGKRGYAASCEEYYKDYVAFMEKIIFPQRDHSKPFFLLAHSMGGMLQLLTLARHASQNSEWNVTAQVCSAPLLGVAVEVPKIKDAAARVMNQVWPTLTLGNELTNNMVTRDLEVIKEFETDIYRHDRISSGVYLSFQPLMEEISRKASEIQTPTLFQCPENDPVVSTPAAREVFKKLGAKDKTLLIYDGGAKHEMYNDTHREAVFADLRRFLQKFFSSSRTT